MNQPLKRRARPAVGPKLKVLLKILFVAFAILVINSIYLSLITLTEWLSGRILQDQIYLYMFLLHLVLGLLIVIPVIVYGWIHINNTFDRPNRRAVKAGYALFVFAIILLITGLLLTRGLPFFEVKNIQVRKILYWLHAIVPLLVIWLFIMHRLAGHSISWKPVKLTFALTIITIAGFYFLQKDTFFPKETEHHEMNPLFAPSFAQTSDNQLIPPNHLDNNQYCKDCHADVHEGWMNSVHKVSSFNNPSYSFAVNKTREFLQNRDGNNKASRFCAVCHDPVILFSGEFDKDKDFTGTDIGNSGITCTTCHAISDVNSIKGNGAYTLTIPEQYPFTYSEEPFLKWVNATLIKAKPDFHKVSYLKPLHKTPEFCSVCHKVGLIEELNGYKWLRGQNHYDSYFLSGVSGHSVTSFYYPKKAVQNCSQCHMPLQSSDDFGAITESFNGESYVHSHYFEAANSAIRYLNHLKPDANNAMLTDALSVDIFGVRNDGELNGDLIAPLNEKLNLQSGKKYLLETVVRTLKLGHPFTQGTADSNQIWVELNVFKGDELIASSGGIDKQGKVDDWSYFINAYVLDRNGNRVDRRNAEDIFTMLYNHQIPPGAATVIHYGVDFPVEFEGDFTIEAKVFYRKFDTTYYRYFTGDQDKFNDLPIVMLAHDIQEISLSPETDDSQQVSQDEKWQRWNDYGIGLFRSGSLKQAEQAFSMVAQQRGAEGWVNLTRTYLQQGLLDKAQDALNKAAEYDEFRYKWQLSYFAGLINLQNGFLEKAMENFEAVYRSEFKEAVESGFDFSKEYNFLVLYAQTAFQNSKLFEGEKQQNLMQKSLKLYKEALELNPELANAHFGLYQLYSAMGETDNLTLADKHKKLHEKYKTDDNAHDVAIVKARAANKAADHAAENIAVYQLKQPVDFGSVRDFISQNNISEQ